MRSAYERLVRPLLFSLEAEAAHHLAIALLRGASYVDLALRAVGEVIGAVDVEQILDSVFSQFCIGK